VKRENGEGSYPSDSIADWKFDTEAIETAHIPNESKVTKLKLQ